MGERLTLKVECLRLIRRGSPTFELETLNFKLKFSGRKGNGNRVTTAWANRNCGKAKRDFSGKQSRAIFSVIQPIVLAKLGA
jgi:hypothetical protein